MSIITFILVTLSLALLLIHALRRNLSGGSLSTYRAGVRPPLEAFPAKTRENDKMIIIRGVSQSELHQVIQEFCDLYNRDEYQVITRVTLVSDKDYCLTFPYDMAFERFCLLVNYLQYPLERQWPAQVIGWLSIQPGAPGIGGVYAPKKLMIFIPPDDGEGDQVCISSEDRLGYSMKLSRQPDIRMLPGPRRDFEQTPFQPGALTGTTFREFS